MSFQRKVKTTALGAAAAASLLEITTHLPTEGRSSLAYHHFFDSVITPLGRRVLDPESAHHLALDVVRWGLAPRLSREEGGGDGSGRVDMSVEIAGGGGGRKLLFPGPIGLAAGFDKNGTAISGLFDVGFSYVEIGSVTPLPQPGNARPRSFRLVEDRGVINRFGFNSEGACGVRARLEEYRSQFGGRGSGDAVVSSTTTTTTTTTTTNAEVGEKEEEGGSSAMEEGGEWGGYRSITTTSVGNSFLWALGWAWSRVMTTPPRTGVLGVNLGKNKTSADEVGVSPVRRALLPFSNAVRSHTSRPSFVANFTVGHSHTTRPPTQYIHCRTTPWAYANSARTPITS